MSRNTIRTIASSIAAAALALAASSASAQVTDTVQAPTGFFVPTDAQKYDDPYWRFSDQDWGWTHSAIGGSITSATLNISAFDVDFSSGEIDNIYAYDNGVAVLLGALAGGSDIYSFTEFVLGANFYDDIANGLQVFVDIDTAQAGWQLTLAKSSLSVNGGVLPDPSPGVPEPAAWGMLIGGFGLAGAAMRRRYSTTVRLAA